MREASAELRKFELRGRELSLFAVMGCAVVLLGGCAAQKRVVIPWRTAVLVRPVLPEGTASSANEESVAEGPDLQLDTPPPEPVFVPRSGPMRPRVYTPPPARETQTGKPETPQIVPQLSAQESSELQRETEASLSDAERNVAAASQRNLNATEADLASKVRGFISDARAAGKAGDWSRARDLARKAQVLSQELSSS
jgi:hypothetical protein